MPATYIENDALRQRLIDTLGKKQFESNEAVTWTTIIVDSNAAAANEIKGALLARGFTLAQIDAWDRRVEFNTDLGLFWCLVKGGCTHLYDPTFIMLLDRRAELKEVPVIIDGEPVDPEADDATPSIRSGPLVNSSDVFTMDSKW